MVAAGTLTSRVLGFARDVVLAAVFPTGVTDLFYVAFTIPNALRVLLGEGAVSAAVVPVFSEVRAKEGEEAARAYFARLTGLLALVLAIVSALGVLAAPLLVSVYATGYLLEAPDKYADTVALTRVVFPYIFFMGLAALGMGGLNALRRFAVPAFAPALLNVALIAAAFLLVSPALSLGLPAVGALAVGALIGGALQLLAQWPSQRAAGLLRAPRLSLRDPAVKKTLALMVPVLAGFGVYQLNTMLGRTFLSFSGEGAQSYIYYGQRLVEIPQGDVRAGHRGRLAADAERSAAEGRPRAHPRALRLLAPPHAAARHSVVGDPRRARRADRGRGVRARRLPSAPTCWRPRARWPGRPRACGPSRRCARRCRSTTPSTTRARR
ncbi:MAG: murein biosynthesis integral membrane protein MurJ [Sandaracinaceae bacterium]|nr:murein biosynthesis integral membrane protein MurJ [Sandaracinaceae bacterium]